MKIVTTYIAYDGVEFETMEECREYEQFAWDMAIEIIENTVIYDDLHRIIIPPYFHTLDEVLNWFEEMYGSIQYIKVKKEIPSSADCWQLNYFGYILPTDVGIYYYDYVDACWKTE